MFQLRSVLHSYCLHSVIISALKLFRTTVEDFRISSEVTFKDFLEVLVPLVHKVSVVVEDNQEILRKWVIWAMS